MIFSHFGLPTLSLSTAIDSQFVTLSADTPLPEVLTFMSQLYQSCGLEAGGAERGENQYELYSFPTVSCVLVTEKEQLLGVFTERDIVRLTARSIPFTDLTLGEVISHPPIYLKHSPDHDLFTALSLLKQHKIRHLPIVNQELIPLGIVTHGSIRKALQPVQMLTRFHHIADVMETDIVHAYLSDSVLQIAQKMNEHRVSCVVITDVHPLKSQLLIPLGIITERDIVQFQSLQLNLAQVSAQTVMSYPLFCLSPENPLWEAHQQMNQQRVRRLVIVGKNQELLGLVSQSSLLKVLNPADMYGVIESLQSVIEERTHELEQANKQLREEIREREKAELALQKAHDQLKQKIAQQNTELKTANELLKQDIVERQLVEIALRKSETELKEKAQELQLTLERLQKTQTKLVQNEKMSSLGQLVGGIAHEINNPINFIYGNLTYAEEYITDILSLLETYQSVYPDPPEIVKNKIEHIDLAFIQDDLLKLLDSMKFGAERIRDLILSLRNFARLDEAILKRVNIHEGIESTLIILNSQLQIPENYSEIKVEKNYDDLGRIECYPGPLNQVFFNLISNAIDAIKEKLNRLSEEDYIPLISIETENCTSRNSVIIRIRDNGVGIKEDIQAQIFNPFFTTKPVGQGTGLGLSVTHQIIIERHRGKLDFSSQWGVFTEFVIEIPKFQY